MSRYFKKTKGEGVSDLFLKYLEMNAARINAEATAEVIKDSFNRQYVVMSKMLTVIANKKKVKLDRIDKLYITNKMVLYFVSLFDEIGYEYKKEYVIKGREKEDYELKDDGLNINTTFTLDSLDSVLSDIIYKYKENIMCGIKFISTSPYLKKETKNELLEDIAAELSCCYSALKEKMSCIKY